MQQVVGLNGNAVIQCISYSKPRWQFSGGPVPSNALVDLNIIILLNVTAENGGGYECKGTTDSGLEFWATSTLYVAG